MGGNHSCKRYVPKIEMGGEVVEGGLQGGGGRGLVEGRGGEGWSGLERGGEGRNKVNCL